MNIALLHLSLRVGELAYNAELAEKAIMTAASLGARWIVTPELCLTGYDFTPLIGADWIAAPEDDTWLARFRATARMAGVVLFMGHPERDVVTGKLYNSVFAIDVTGAILGRHRKINTLQGAESWSSKGGETAPVEVQGLRIGLLVCADAYSREPTHGLTAAGAELLISAANWAPKPHGPDGCWERRSAETGLPVFVCNRTGMDKELDFTPSETTLAHRGERVVTFQSDASALVLVDWDVKEHRLVGHTVHALHATNT